MRITYDPRADAMFIEFRDERPNDSIDVDASMTADRDAGRRVIGIELLDVRERLGGDPPRDVTIEWLTDDDDA